MLKARDQQTGRGLLAFGLPGKALFAQRAVFVQQGRKAKFGGIGRQTGDVELDDVAFREAALDLADVVLEAANHHIVEHLFLGLDTAAESLGIEDFQQGRETVGMAVVRRGREEQAVLKPIRQLANGAGDLRVDGVFLAAGRGRVVGFVQD